MLPPWVIALAILYIPVKRWIERRYLPVESFAAGLDAATGSTHPLGGAAAERGSLAAPPLLDEEDAAALVAQVQPEEGGRRIPGMGAETRFGGFRSFSFPYNGRRVDVAVMGRGGPAVVLNCGSIAAARPLMVALSKHTTVIAYTHAGLTILPDGATSTTSTGTGGSGSEEEKEAGTHHLTTGSSPWAFVQRAATDGYGTVRHGFTALVGALRPLPFLRTLHQWLSATGDPIPVSSVLLCPPKQVGTAMPTSEVEAKELAAVLRHCGMDRAVLVSQHYNWLATLKTALRNEGRVAGVVMLDPLLPTARTRLLVPHAAQAAGVGSGSGNGSGSAAAQKLGQERGSDEEELRLSRAGHGGEGFALLPRDPAALPPTPTEAMLHARIAAALMGGGSGGSGSGSGGIGGGGRGPTAASAAVAAAGVHGALVGNLLPALNLPPAMLVAPQQLVARQVGKGSSISWSAPVAGLDPGASAAALSGAAGAAAAGAAAAASGSGSGSSAGGAPVSTRAFAANVLNHSLGPSTALLASAEVTVTGAELLDAVYFRSQVTGAGLGPTGVLPSHAYLRQVAHQSPWATRVGLPTDPWGAAREDVAVAAQHGGRGWGGKKGSSAASSSSSSSNASSTSGNSDAPTLAEVSFNTATTGLYSPFLDLNRLVATLEASNNFHVKLFNPGPAPTAAAAGGGAVAGIAGGIGHGGGGGEGAAPDQLFAPPSWWNPQRLLAALTQRNAVEAYSSDGWMHANTLQMYLQALRHRAVGMAAGATYQPVADADVRSDYAWAQLECLLAENHVYECVEQATVEVFSKLMASGALAAPAAAPPSFWRGGGNRSHNNSNKSSSSGDRSIAAAPVLDTLRSLAQQWSDAAISTSALSDNPLRGAVLDIALAQAGVRWPQRGLPLVRTAGAAGLPSTAASQHAQAMAAVGAASAPDPRQVALELRAAALAHAGAAARQRRRPLVLGAAIDEDAAALHAALTGNNNNVPAALSLDNIVQSYCESSVKWTSPLLIPFSPYRWRVPVHLLDRFATAAADIKPGELMNPPSSTTLRLTHSALHRWLRASGRSDVLAALESGSIGGGGGAGAGVGAAPQAVAGATAALSDALRSSGMGGLAANISGSGATGNGTASSIAAVPIVNNDGAFAGLLSWVAANAGGARSIATTATHLAREWAEDDTAAAAGKGNVHSSRTSAAPGAGSGPVPVPVAVAASKRPLPFPVSVLLTKLPDGRLGEPAIMPPGVALDTTIEFDVDALVASPLRGSVVNVSRRLGFIQGDTASPPSPTLLLARLAIRAQQDKLRGAWTATLPDCVTIIPAESYSDIRKGLLEDAARILRPRLELEEHFTLLGAIAQPLGAALLRDWKVYIGSTRKQVMDGETAPAASLGNTAVLQPLWPALLPRATGDAADPWTALADALAYGPPQPYRPHVNRVVAEILAAVELERERDKRARNEWRPS